MQQELFCLCRATKGPLGAVPSKASAYRRPEHSVCVTSGFSLQRARRRACSAAGVYLLVESSETVPTRCSKQGYGVQPRRALVLPNKRFLASPG